MPKVMGEEFDYIGLMADWEEMKVTIDETFKQVCSPRHMVLPIIATDICAV